MSCTNMLFHWKIGEADEEGEASDRDGGTGGGLYPGAPDHDASPKPATRLKEKRMNRLVPLPWFYQEVLYWIFYYD